MKATPEELRRHADAGRSIKEAATELGVSYATVFKRAKREGIAQAPAINPRKGQRSK
jgi:transposase